MAQLPSFASLVAQLKSGQISKDELFSQLGHVAAAKASLPSERGLAQADAEEEREHGDPQRSGAVHFDERTAARPAGDGRQGPWAERGASNERDPPLRRGRHNAPPYIGGETAHAQATGSAPLPAPDVRANQHYPHRMHPEWQVVVGANEAEQRARELAECTFQPRINPRSRLPRNQYGGLPPGRLVEQHAFPEASVYDRSLAWARERRANQLEIRERQREEEMADCTFKPALISRRRNVATRQASGVRADPRAHAGARARSASPRTRSRSPRMGKEGRGCVANGRSAPPPPEPHREPSGASRPRRQSARSRSPQRRQARRSGLGAVEVHARYLEPRPRRPSHEGAEAATLAQLSRPTLTARQPAVLSSPALHYLRLDPFERLAHGRVPHDPHRTRATTPLGARSGSGATGPAAGARPVSAPRERTAVSARDALAEGEVPEEERSRLFEAKLRFHEFLQRQQRQLRKRAQTQALLERGAPPARPASAAEHAERRRKRAEFARRVAGSIVQYQRRKEVARPEDQPLPLAEAELVECTFQPRIHPASAGRRTRTTTELAYGDALHRKLVNVELTERVRAKEAMQLRSFPLTSAPLAGVDGLLKLSSDPASFVERMRERARVKQELIDSVRGAQIQAELAACTFKPSTRTVPEFVKRMGEHALAARIHRYERLNDLALTPLWH